MTVDYAGSSPQNQRATNCTMNYTQAYSIYPIKCVLDPYTRRNEGSYRPITVTAPEGSIINAKYPAAVAARHLSGHTLSCAIYQALAEVVPDRIIADSGGARPCAPGWAGWTTTAIAIPWCCSPAPAWGLACHGRPFDHRVSDEFGSGQPGSARSGVSLLFRKKEFRPDLAARAGSGAAWARRWR
jgi:N-methylhydantoinase B